MAQQALDSTEKAILTYVADAWQEIGVYKKGPQGHLGTLSYLPPRDTLDSPVMEVTMGGHRPAQGQRVPDPGGARQAHHQHQGPPGHRASYPAITSSHRKW